MNSLRTILTTCSSAIITGSALNTLIIEGVAQFPNIEFCVNKTAMINAQDLFFLNTCLKTFFFYWSAQYIIQIANTRPCRFGGLHVPVCVGVWAFVCVSVYVCVSMCVYVCVGVCTPVLICLREINMYYMCGRYY